jgi:hypothetical protein
MATTHPDDFRIPKTGVFGDSFGRSAAALSNPSVFDAAAGTVVTLLAIIGLAGAAPRVMAAISFIAVGIAFVMEAAGIARRSQAMALSRDRLRSQIMGSVLTELVASVAGFALALLALVGVTPFVMLAIASVSFGIAIVFGTGASMQVDAVASYLEPSQTRRWIHEAVVGASGARFLVALASTILGLLALAGVERPTLLLTSALTLGVALLLGAVSLGDRMPPSPPSSES